MAYNELYHYGVKGMKWGVRKAPVRSGHTPSKSKNTKRSIFGFKKKESTVKVKPKPKHKTTIEENPQPKKKSVKDMSDSELRDAISRIKLEDEYNRLNPKQITTGKKFVDRVVNNIILPAGEDVAKQLVKSGMTKAVNELFELDDEFKVFTNNKKK